MATLKELGSLPPIAVELDLFDYVPLDSPREPPPVELRARLARSYEADEEEGEGLRLAFVAGRPVESHDLLVLAYLWRPPPKGVAWGIESWPSPERRLRLYRSGASRKARVRRVGSAISHGTTSAPAARIYDDTNPPLG